MDNSLAQQIAQTAAAGIKAARERQKAEDEEIRKSGRIPLKQLPLWPEPERTAPSVVLRSALFRTAKSKRASFYKEKIAVWKNYNIAYTGLELTQHHLDVWLQALHMSRQQLGTKIGFTVRGFMKQIGRKGTGAHDRDWLDGVLTGLSANTVTVSSNDNWQIYSGSLVHSFSLEGNNCYLEINPDLIPLFEDGYTKLGWVERLALKGNIAKWLHAYVCSHRATPKRPSKISLVRLMELCGSSRGQLRWFKQDLKKAMTQLDNLGVVESWDTDNDVLTFVRPPSQRQLTKTTKTPQLLGSIFANN